MKQGSKWTRLAPILPLPGRAECRAALAGISVSKRHLTAALRLWFAGGMISIGYVWDAAPSLTRQFLSKDHRNELTLLFCGKLGDVGFCLLMCFTQWVSLFSGVRNWKGNRSLEKVLGKLLP